MVDTKNYELVHVKPITSLYRHLFIIIVSQYLIICYRLDNIRFRFGYLVLHWYMLKNVSR